MIAIVFEDGENTPSSMLLKTLDISGQLYFANGNGSLSDKIQEVRDMNKYEVIYVYIDLVLNNPETISLYNSLLSMKLSEGWVNVHIVPIICLEYHVLKVFYRNNWLDTRGLEDIIESIIKENDFSVVLSKYENKSYETLLKGKLNSCVSRCQRNTTHAGNSVIGKFYFSDCKCDSKYCYKNLVGLAAKEKALKLYMSLPVVTVTDSMLKECQLYSINIMKLDLAVLQKFLQELFDEIANQLNLDESFYVNIKL